MPIELRPYKPEYDDQVIELAARHGYSWAQIGSALGLRPSDLDAMVESQPSFAAAVEIADRATWDWWVERGQQLALDPDAPAHAAKTWEVAMRMRYGDAAFRNGIKPPSPWAKAPAPPPRKPGWR